MLWTSAELASAEHFTLESQAGGQLLSGTTVVVFDDRPAHIRYSVGVDHEWRTGAVDVEIVDDRQRTVQMRVDDGAWRVDSVARADLVGCVDVDLGWTPATNTLPIRRLRLDIGESAEITAAWLKFPELVVVANRQRYVREGDRRWRYVSGEYDFVLETNADGVVTRYGDDLWVARATSRT